MSKDNISYIGAISFEERSISGLSSACAGDSLRAGRAELIHFGINPKQLDKNISKVRSEHGLEAVELDRFDTKGMWNWVWNTVSNCKPSVTIDATCLPRELLGMLIFALSVRRESMGKTEILYTYAPSGGEGGYATQNQALSDDEKWLSKGIIAIRSIVGYPGYFSSERKCHAIALVGHEFERMLEMLKAIEPSRCSLGNEKDSTSTVDSAGDYSEGIANRLREGLRKYVAVPEEIVPVNFHANSIKNTLEELKHIDIRPEENTALIAMNTKLSFIGAALYALQKRSVRMIYSVPEKYNPSYCIGAGETESTDITEYLNQAKTTPVS